MASNNFIQGLYEMAKSDNQVDPLSGMPKMDEQKLRRALDQNRKLGSRNRDNYEAGERKFKTCPRYDPCPICDKCRAKASHLYVACQTCKIPICSHTYADRDKMIKRKNFTVMVSQETMKAIKHVDFDLMIKQDEERLGKRLLHEKAERLCDTSELDCIQALFDDSKPLDFGNNAYHARGNLSKQIIYLKGDN